MATAKKLPSGSWRCLVYDYTDNNGKRHYASFTSDDPTSRGKRDAEFKAAQYALVKHKRTHDTKSLGQAIDEYISSKEGILSPTTIKSYKCTLNSLFRLIPKYLEKDIYKLNNDELQEAIEILSSTRTPKTIRNMYGLITASINKYRNDYVSNISLPQKVRPNLYVPSDEDVKKLLDAARNTELEIPIMLAAFGPMRRGEICALDINRDIVGNIIHVYKNKVLDFQRNYIIKEPKTYSSDRYIEFPDFVINKIKEKGYITTLLPEQLTRKFELLLDKLDIPHFRFHDLRHYAASVLHALNIPDVYIMQRGGWSSDIVLKSVYRHTMNDRQKQMNAIGNEHFSQLYTPPK